jgi:phosphoribosylformylglycinamidine cyclo-ligase
MTYARAGVDISEVGRAHRILARRLQATFRFRRGRAGAPILPIGHYAGLIDVGHGRVLSMHVDGVGTKVMIAQMMKKYDTIGIDCVAMCVNDLICTGSEPVAFLDYIALSKPDARVIEQITDGIVKGARQAEVAVVGGETAIVPDLLSGGKGGGMDLVGMSVGVADRNELLLGDDISAKDVLIGVASSGIHSNGFTLARKVLLRKHVLNEVFLGSGRRLGDELLEPTRIYVKPIKEAKRRAEIHGIAHITGGGLTKLKRIVGRAKFGARIEKLPPAPKIFQLIKQEGHISDDEMYRTFNMGVGLVVVCPENEADNIMRYFTRHRQRAFYLGRVLRKAGIWLGENRIA